jgi:hypothetical protein
MSRFALKLLNRSDISGGGPADSVLQDAIAHALIHVAKGPYPEAADAAIAALSSLGERVLSLVR